jgi:D-sedoheptulose 7-phosphate isomerase
LHSGKALTRAIDLLLQARAAGQRVYGGSAATASHFVGDLVQTARIAGMAPMRAFALGRQRAVTHGMGNDYAYKRSFAEQILVLVKPGDIVVVTSASGNSPNVVAALAAASTRGAQTIGVLGFDCGSARDLVDVTVHIPRDDYGLVENTHAAIAHAVTTGIR